MVNLPSFFWKNSENKQLTTSEQREELLKLNNDIIYWVYDIESNQDWEIKLKLVDDILTCYPNQLTNLKWLKDNKDIVVIDINELRKWKFKILSWKEPDYALHWFSENGSFKTLLDDWHTFRVNRNLTLLSSWVIELIKAKKDDWTYRTHTYTSLRDWWAADALQRTWVAGRNSFEDLSEEVEREYTEESTFLSQIDWVWTFATPNRENSEEAKKDLKISVEYFLKNKYNLDRNNEEQAKFISMFERNFNWKLKYEELWKVLREAIENERITFFENEELDTFPWLEKDMKKLTMLNQYSQEASSWNYFIFHDEANNTIEYRSLREIKIPEWFNPRQRLFLESQNQYAKTHRLENLWKEKIVPAMRHFYDRVEKIV
jgi:hypothetical protein